MKADTFKSEKLYQATMHIVRKLLSDGIITDEEYRRINAVFVEKYNPEVGALLSECSLTLKA